MKHRIVALGAATAVMVAGIFTATAASAESYVIGDDPSDPIILTSLDDLPEGAVPTGTHMRQCETVSTFTLTEPGDELIEHDEYRYLREVPAVEEESYQVYSYVKDVADYKTQWLYVKFTHTKTKPKHGEWSEYGPWTEWSPRSHETWSDTNAASLGTPQFHGEGSTGTGQNKVEWYREWQLRNTGETRQVPNGSHQEFSGEVTTTLGAPWTLLPGYPKKVVTTEAEDAYTLYYVEGGSPSLVESEASWVTTSPGEDWVQFDERTVVDQEETPDVVTYYEYSDGKECAEPTLNVYHTLACGSIDFTLDVADVPDNWRYGIVVEFDEDMPGDAALQIGPGSKEFGFDFEEDDLGGSVSGRYYMTDATEWDLVPEDLDYQATYPVVGDAFRSFTVDTDCESNPDEVTPPTPTVTHEAKVCVVPGYTVKTTSGSITIPAIENVTGVEALLDGKVVAFGKHDATPVTHVVEYRSTDENVVLTGQTKFTLEVKAAANPVCKAPDRPTPNNVHSDISQLNPPGSSNGYTYGVLGAIAAMIAAAGAVVFGRRLTQRRGAQG